jgi:predicted nuclease of predicted toxin-antitoxin system
VKFLIDNQLPAKLAQWLTTNGCPGVHVQEVGLADARDDAILDFAAKWFCVGFQG